MVRSMTAHRNRFPLCPMSLVILFIYLQGIKTIINGKSFISTIIESNS